MKVSEKTLELTLCSQMSWADRRWMWPDFNFGPNQPLWFGLTQIQEARAGFDAATRLGNGRILLLQFKVGLRLKDGRIRFKAPHDQLEALRLRVRNQHRLVLYVLPQVTRTRELLHSNGWILADTWFLDVASIPALGAPGRKSGDHFLTLAPHSGVVTITSDPIDVRGIRATEVLETYGRSSLGARYENFSSFWKYAKLLRGSGVAAAFPSRGA